MARPETGIVGEVHQLFFTVWTLTCELLMENEYKIEVLMITMCEVAVQWFHYLYHIVVYSDYNINLEIHVTCSMINSYCAIFLVIIILLMVSVRRLFKPFILILIFFTRKEKQSLLMCHLISLQLYCYWMNNASKPSCDTLLWLTMFGL